MAEVFSFLMIDENFKKSKDEILRNKIMYMIDKINIIDNKFEF